MSVLPEIVAVVAIIIIYLELAIVFSAPESPIRFPARILALLLIPFVLIMTMLFDLSDEGEELD